jgi:hypothetical protein
VYSLVSFPNNLLGIKMSIAIEAKNEDAGELEFPGGFWPAFCIETPIANLIDCKYKDETEMVIVYEHEGYVGAWFSENEALEMHKLLSEYVKTSEFKNHRYFSERADQMDMMLDFLPNCGGFRVV